MIEEDTGDDHEKICGEAAVSASCICRLTTADTAVAAQTTPTKAPYP